MRHTAYRAILFTAALLNFLVWPLTASAQPAPSDSLDYAVRVGDQVEVSVFTASGQQLQAVEGERIVDRTGRIYLPLVGSTSVVGLNADQIRELLIERFAAFYESPVVDLSVKLRVNVTGAVPNPGNYFVHPASTIIDALSIAGGTGTGLQTSGSGQGAADASAVQLVRGGERTVLDIRPEAVNEQLVNMQVQSGDWIFVPPRTRSRLRDDVNFLSSVLALIGGIVFLATR